MNVGLMLKNEIDSGRDFTYSWGVWLDCFYRSSKDRRNEMIKTEPDLSFLDLNTRAFVAASVHKLCNDYDLPIPAWVSKTEYFLKEPYFVGNPQGLLRIVYLVESPPEFKIRKIFTSDNTLARV